MGLPGTWSGPPPGLAVPTASEAPSLRPSRPVLRLVSGPQAPAGRVYRGAGRMDLLQLGQLRGRNLCLPSPSGSQDSHRQWGIPRRQPPESLLLGDRAPGMPQPATSMAGSFPTASDREALRGRPASAGTMEPCAPGVGAGAGRPQAGGGAGLHPGRPCLPGPHPGPLPGGTRGSWPDPAWPSRGRRWVRQADNASPQWPLCARPPRPQGRTEPTPAAASCWQAPLLGAPAPRPPRAPGPA